MKKRLAVVTYGCQMNERDSEEVLGMLTAQGYEIAEQPESADVILLNTCSVRQHAEDRAMGKMFELSELKDKRPDLVLGIIGCMAKLQQGQLFKRLPQLDLVAGPAELYDLPYLLAEIQEKRQGVSHAAGDAAGGHPHDGGRGGWGARAADFGNPPGRGVGVRLRQDPLPSKLMAVERKFRPLDAKPAGDYHKPGVRAFVTIMEGCDKACTYCIVPKTRGQEISRPAEEIIGEINRLHAAGYQEVILLGQNVNSYGKRFPDGSGYKGPLGRLRLLEEDPESLLDFPQLLRMIDASILGGSCRCATPHPSSPSDYRAGSAGGCGGPGTSSPAVRIRFTTSHPFDANERLFRAMAECESVCEWLHLPAQSGSNRILRAMRRGYTAEQYLAKINQLRALIPQISFSTDIIVGFPGETEEDFQATVRLMREVRFDNAYVFKYSPRPGTDAAAREDSVPQEVKEARHQVLLALQAEIDTQGHQALEGRTVEILVEETGKFGGQWFGRTRGNHGVIVASPARLAGQLVQARITRTTAHTLFGEVLSS